MCMVNMSDSLPDRQTCPVPNGVAHPRVIRIGFASAPLLPLRLLNSARHVLERLPLHPLQYPVHAAVSEAKTRVLLPAICQLISILSRTSFSPLISSSISRRRSASNAS
jgi:hypothetical protein